MLYSDHKNIKDIIIETLVERRLSAKEIKEVLIQQGQTYSLHAIYDALRTLLDAGVILKHQNQYFVSEEWKKAVVQHLHVIPQEPKLEIGEQQKYIFRSTVQLDKFWKHTNAVLLQQYPNEPIFFYAPHEFWLYNLEQKDSQEAFLSSFKVESRSAYMLIGGETELDFTCKKRFKESMSIHLDKSIKFKRNEYITVLNDLVITVRIPVSLSKTIDGLYLSHIEESKLQSIIIPILSQEVMMTVVIKNDPQKATKLRKRITKDMYVPLTERERFNLS